MNYNPIIDIALLGTALAIVGLIIHVTQKPKRGAILEPDRQKLKEHQAVRRILMEEGEFR